MKLTIDFETRSTVDLKKHGVDVYAEDETTDVLCLAIKLGDNPPQLWVPGKFKHLYKRPILKAEEIIKTIEAVEIVEAHNVGFETAIWHHIMHNRYGFPDLPKEKLRCSAAVAASLSLPRALGKACEVMGVHQQKDKEGAKIMMKMCKPRRALKADKEKYPEWESMTLWHEDPAEFVALCEYCAQDVEAEHALSEAIGELIPKELELFQLDQAINNRGVMVDVAAIDNIKEKVKAKEATLLDEVQMLTDGAVKSVRQIAASLKWLEGQGITSENLQKETVVNLLKKELPVKVRRFLEIRQSLGKSSVSKLDAMKRWAGSDSRVRGSMLYHGASTGRWAGKGIQPQNYPRDSYGDYDIGRILNHEDYVSVDADYWCTIQAASKCLRGMITCEEDSLLYCADFSSIEARVLAWLAGEDVVLEAFRNGLDFYKVAAQAIYGVGYDEVDDDQRKIGKVSELACGYQGAVGAFQTMAPVYGVYVPDKQAKDIVVKWRRERPNIVKFWAEIEKAAVLAVSSGLPHGYNGVKYEVKGRFLKCKLHSGRELSYCDPEVKEVYYTAHSCKNEDCDHFWQKKNFSFYPKEDTVCPKCGATLENIEWYNYEKDELRFMGIDSYTNQWKRQSTYGGKLTENIVQGEARDLMRDALIRLAKAGYDIVMHVHDEVIAEVKKVNAKPLAEFESIMAEVPMWALGLPIGADGWVGKRYRKG